MNKKSTKVALYIVVLFMMSTGIIYFVAASQEVGEANAEVGSVETNENELGNLEEHETTTQNLQIMGLPLDAGIQTALFAVAGAAYVPVGLWILETKQRNKTPYIVAIVGSLSLILLYVASRTISLPIVGLQDDVGSIDILSKILQGGIIAGSIYILTTFKPQIKSNATA
ncbi:MAG TPA: hypothetical protein VLD38_06740 [Nitrosopumilaceae archaeon]|nr:hypothetical protein [Nitrosopumilaceae archaeon]